jgi:hypothetical protein
VTFFADGVAIDGCVDTAAPYECNWTADAAGSVNLTAQATDNNGIATLSTAVVVAVNNPGSEPPVVTITSPANGAIVKVGEPVLITVNATVGASSVNASIEQVAFFANGTEISGCVDTTSPFECTWTPTVVGSYNLTALATDDEGNVGTALAVTVTAKEDGGNGQQQLFLPLVRQR